MHFPCAKPGIIVGVCDIAQILVIGIEFAS
jgi:hypothetical protein